MLKSQLTSKLAGILIDTINKTGKKSHISDESRINRKYLTRSFFRLLRFHILVRLLYNTAMWTDRKDFAAIGAKLFDEIWLLADKHGYDFNDEPFV